MNVVSYIRWFVVKYSICVVCIGILFGLSGCQSSQPVADTNGALASGSAPGSNSDSSANSNSNPNSVTEYSLSEDRSKLDQLRAEIPAATRKKNDDLAFILKNMGEVKRPPSEVREKFNTAIYRLREKFEKDMSQNRESFNSSERQNRESFSKGMDDQRKALNDNKKMSQKEKKQKYDELENKRKDFYAKEREGRFQFESNFRQKRADFDDMIRSQTQEFNREHRTYSKRYEDWTKENEKLNKLKQKSTYGNSSADTDALQRELDQIPNTPGERIGP